MNIFGIILVIGSLFALLSVTLTLTACMLSSRISQTEEFVEMLVHAVNHQMDTALVLEDHVE